MPRWLPPVLAVSLLVAGLAIPSWGGAIALCGLAVLLGWLALVSWPRLPVQGRIMRIAGIAAVLIIAGIRALH